MARYRKLRLKALENPGSLRFNELCKLAEQLGFVLDRIRGSHFIYKHRNLRRPLNFQNVNGEAKPFQVKQLLEAAEELNLIKEEN